MIVFIDSGVLGILTNPNKLGEAYDCEQWLYTLLSHGVHVCSSDICDFEVRRSLVLASQKKTELNSIQNLDELREIIDFLPITSALLKQAASLWAAARSQGIPTADDKSLDVDIIISGHWQILKEDFPGRYIVIATTNVKHLSRFTEAKVWRDIKF
ncbi:type II toxin-antitoxin system VapC family toxin [Brasilonema octagenarum UFV-E1]|uniref:Type II toxin-antitoxin system VapC family toxin n=1 Tax=Brasilonema sennae CENA114 TaxID=415709 RepID=A0A856MNR6_9CYAN|nr:type II toxin-antitoxin system VapC family toxin [Brasilonema sennae]QDL11141.1 type II toxin-antitoxin system VapC family toxin [Brasilonema sennae CENA114]QDL17487.1 type II toxin-antitoxin system VapC family toxin [Brasilonema octagenarum UFV-E1]